MTDDLEGKLANVEVEEPGAARVLGQIVANAGHNTAVGVGKCLKGIGTGLYSVTKAAVFLQTVSLLPGDVQEKLVSNDTERKLYNFLNSITQPFVSVAVTFVALNHFSDIYAESSAVILGLVFSTEFGVSLYKALDYTIDGNLSGHPIMEGTYYLLKKSKIKEFGSNVYDNAKNQIIEKQKKQLTQKQAQGALSLSDKVGGELAMVEEKGNLAVVDDRNNDKAYK